MSRPVGANPAPGPVPAESSVPVRRGRRTVGRAFTLLEALIASVIVAMVAATASVSVAVGAAVEEQNRLAVLAMQAAELQMGTVLETDYDDMESLAGDEAAGAMLAPLRAGAQARMPLPPGFALLSRTTAIVAENRTFTQYNSYVVPGKRIEVTVRGPGGHVLARLVRFRGRDPET
jgi:type II secretory pathway component PulJ